MKIGIDCREITGKFTGISRFLIEFLREAKKYDRFEFILFGNHYTDFTDKTLSDYKKIVINEKITIWYDQIKLKNAIKKNKLDLFFSPYYKIPIFTNTPTINALFDVIYLLVEPYKYKLKNRFYIRNFIKFTSKKVKKILTCSYATKNDLIKELCLPPEKIEIVYLSIGKDFYPRSGYEVETVKKTYGIYKKYILYVGNSRPHKNLTNLIKAYKLLPSDLQNEYLLVLAGMGRFEVKDIECKIINFVPDQDLPCLYSGAELFVFPSLYEGFGLPPVEAMACGCPVVSSGTSSMPEVLGDACLYFDPYSVKEMSDTIQKVLLDKELKNTLRQKGIQQAKNYTTEKMVANILSIFNHES